jgi:signal transduction histidine kinase
VPHERVVPPAVDLVVAAGAAVVLVVGAILAAAGQQRGLDALAVALLVLSGLALGWRRTAPVATVAATVLLNGLYLVLDRPLGPIQLPMMVAIFELARLRPLRLSGPVCAVASVMSVAAVMPRFIAELSVPALLAALWLAWLVVPWSLGALVGVQTAAAARSRQELLLRGALEERVRLAREVHDVAGHGFAVIAMQAGVAEVVFDEQPDQVRTSLAAIRETSTRALDELRATLAAVRGEATDVGGLVERVRAGGVPVELVVEVDAEIPPAVATVAYRVVQESLTNVMRHTDAAPTTVSLRTDGENLLVEIIDVGPPVGPPGSGQGLTGMRTRVDGAGGELQAAPTEAGFRVWARLPLDAR